MMRRTILPMLLTLLALHDTAPAATVQPFYTQSSASDFISPGCDSGRQAGSTECSAAGQALRDGAPFFGGEAKSYADAAKGILHASAMSFGNAQFSPRVDGEASASARIFDTLTFNGLIGPNDIATVTMIATLTHSDIGLNGLSKPFGRGSAFMQLEALASDGTVMARAFHCTPGSLVCVRNPSYNRGGFELDVHDNTYTIRGSFRLFDLGISPTLQLLLSLGTQSQGFASANADDPILITLPAGVTFTSASGIFLSAVPLPASLPLLAGALLGLGARRRRPD